MLEVKNLKKEYKTKKGAVTKALDDVSLTFPETGMVFILGKSGSGKSTLLNVCGGLDRMDSGEIIIKGKSSKDFSTQDFDSYRNTYVGFVFQEYNILDEFTVEQNIALALELQNKKPDKAIIDKILADVDLTDFALRKPNTLSGGQKQRVAIARALVKEPQIIMADEPTGALDSKTGQQVFDTLKKLSKEKLVLVISHDRDFAEQYGDRIIELKDGKIISDQVRAETEGGDDTVGETAGLRFFGTDTVCITNGAKITDADLASIKSFLGRSGGAAVISTSREKISQFKEDRPEISMGTFDNIKEQPTSKQYEPQKLIRSHLPVKHAIKMGAGSLKTKPVRLVFTIFLSIVAFVLFGLATTLMLFDGREVSVQSFTDSKINYISLGKIYYVTYDYGDGEKDTDKRDTMFTQAEYDELVKTYTGAIPMISHGISINNLSLSNSASRFYSSYLEGVVPASDKLTLLAGRMPTADDEVAITDFIFDAAKSTGSRFVYGEDNIQLTISSYDDVLYSEHKPIVARTYDGDYKVVGVFKGSQVPDEYSSMKHSADNGSQSEDSGFSSWMWDTERRSGMYMTIAVSDEVFKFMASNRGGSNKINYNEKYFKGSKDSATVRAVEVEGKFEEYGIWQNDFSRFAKYEGNTLNIYGLDGTQKTSLANGEAAISSRGLMEALHNSLGNLVAYIDDNYEYRDALSSVGNNAYNEYSETHSYPDYYADEFYDLTPEQLAEFIRANKAWEDDRNAFIQDVIIAQGHEEGSEEYESMLSGWEGTHWKPQKMNYGTHNDDKYDQAVQDYNADREAYVDAAVDEVRIEEHKKYAAIVKRLEAEADAKYRDEHPEPSADNDEAHDKWQQGLDSAVYYSNPLYLLGDMLNTNEREYSFEEISHAINLTVQTLDEIGILPSFTIGNETTTTQTIDIVAYFVENAGYSCYLGADLYDTFYVERQDYYQSNEQTKYEEPEDAFISYILIPYDGSRAIIEQLLNKSDVKQSDDSSIKIKNAIVEQLDMVIDTADTMEMVFIIAGSVLALFAFLLMFNFISASITAKKKDIGILRAIGARTLDVFKIFISEAFIIALICFAISAIGTFGLCLLLNSVIVEDVGLSISLFVFGPLSVLSVFGVAFITALISTIIPVAIYSRKPPIASIRAL